MNGLKIHRFTISSPLKKQLVRFILAFFIAWLTTVFLFDFPYFSRIWQHTGIDLFIQRILVDTTQGILTGFGFHTVSLGKYLTIIGSPGVRFEFGCLGLRHILLFTIFILIQYGKLRHKSWYIPLGILILIFVNSVRAVIILIAQHLKASSTGWVHDITTPILMYTTIFVLWVIWIEQFTSIQSPVKHKNTNELSKKRDLNR